MQSLFSHESDFEGIFIFDLKTDPKIGMIMCTDGEGVNITAEFLRPNGIREHRALVQEWESGNIIRLNHNDARALDSEVWV